VAKIYSWKIEKMEVTDGQGRVYVLPDSLRVMDCAACGVLMTRRFDIVGPKTTQPKMLGGHLFDINGHARPHCHDCYLRQRGINYRSLGITDG